MIRSPGDAWFKTGPHTSDTLVWTFKNAQIPCFLKKEECMDLRPTFESIGPTKEPGDDSDELKSTNYRAV